MSTNVYVLACEKRKRYVGTYSDIQSVVQTHNSENGPEWTKKYKPVAIERTHENVDSEDEDRITKELMSIFGINSVRGGSYSSIELTHEQKEYLGRVTREIVKCSPHCKDKTHYVKDCDDEDDEEVQHTYLEDEGEEEDDLDLDDYLDEQDEYDDCDEQSNLSADDAGSYEEEYYSD